MSCRSRYCLMCFCSDSSSPRVDEVSNVWQSVLAMSIFSKAHLLPLTWQNKKNPPAAVIGSLSGREIDGAEHDITPKSIISHRVKFVNIWCEKILEVCIMKLCPNCKCENQDNGKFCRECGTPFPVEELKSVDTSSNLQPSVQSVISTHAHTIMPVPLLKEPPVILGKIKAWLKDPISIISASVNGVLLVLTIVLLMMVCTSAPSTHEGITNYAQTNNYVLAEFDKYNSPASENGLENTKVYFSGKIKELTNVESFKVALIEDSKGNGNIWCVVFFDNYIYSKLKEKMNITVFGYYSGYSNVVNAPTVYYSNGYFNGEWNEYEDVLGVFKTLDNESTKTDTDTAIVDYDDTSSEEESAVNTNEGKLGDYYVEIVSARVGKDYKKRNCLIVEYKFTNNSSEATHFSIAMSYTAFQDGIELDKAYSFDKKYDNDSDTRDIKPGKTLTVYTAYLLNDKKNSVEVEVSEAWSFNDSKVTKTFELSE